MIGRDRVYRVEWEKVHGPIPPGGVIHHTCGNVWCIEVTHLRLMTQGQHVQGHGLGGDWGQAQKMHCPQGHPYDDENTYVYRRKDGRIERHCRECRREARRRWRRKEQRCD
jgi:hypothetical protein